MSKSNSKNGFSERLAVLMQQKQLTFAQIANAVGKSAPSVHRWANGGEIDYENLRVLANFLEVNWIWLRYGDDAIQSIQDVVQGQRQSAMTDIRRKYLTDIMESEARMKLTLEMAGVVSWEWNVLTGSITFSDNAKQVFGVEPEQIRAKLLPFEEMLLEDLIDQFDVATPPNWDFSLNDSKTNEERWFNSRGMLVRDSMQRPSKLMAISADITDRKRAEKALEFSDLMMRNMIDIIPVGLCGADKDGHIHLLNPEVKRIWGGERYVDLDKYGEYKGWKEADGNELGAEGWALARAVKHGEIVAKETVNIQAFDGEKRTIVMYAMPLLDADKQIVGAIEVNQDITDAKNLERTYKIGLQNWDAIFSQESYGVMVLKGSNRIEAVNKKIAEICGKNEAEILKRGLEIIFGDDTCQRISDLLSKFKKGVVSTHRLTAEVKKHSSTSKAYTLLAGEILVFVDARDESRLKATVLMLDSF
ncbi:PAS domain-containing protein [Methylotenera versatilis]|uniref:PAS domain-containing protein n=1 Tax=Methylotenera versatilis TaxID=1055487 RepID=UPI000689C9A9|nr:PAS domain-containing protein [Methylotenera versatilis]